ncbi:unnamed protein product [Vitrella brassicaformis CCMP3155]|uniref:EF-hand domain-containing protein n=3 Tax=Vitrella brassicaformis TaxID=1169539 RepID=A0A0G4GH38_VITBC|nr:unnamed protein product [Vitrella brassicaformis CCMP3155]|eukprot:CEM28999.1 unnamed protein product [Vitrella brassicaformis CCMP3155]
MEPRDAYQELDDIHRGILALQKEVPRQRDVANAISHLTDKQVELQYTAGAGLPKGGGSGGPLSSRLAVICYAQTHIHGIPFDGALKRVLKKRANVLPSAGWSSGAKQRKFLQEATLAALAPTNRWGPGGLKSYLEKGVAKEATKALTQGESQTGKGLTHDEAAAFLVTEDAHAVSTTDNDVTKKLQASFTEPALSALVHTHFGTRRPPESMLRHIHEQTMIECAQKGIPPPSMDSRGEEGLVNVLADALTIDLEKVEYPFRETAKRPGFVSVQVTTRLPTAIWDPVDPSKKSITSNELSSGVFVARCDFEPGTVRHLRFTISHNQLIKTLVGHLAQPEASFERRLRKKFSDGEAQCALIKHAVADLCRRSPLIAPTDRSHRQAAKDASRAPSSLLPDTSVTEWRQPTAADVASRSSAKKSTLAPHGHKSEGGREEGRRIGLGKGMGELLDLLMGQLSRFAKVVGPFLQGAPGCVDLISLGVLRIMDDVIDTYENQMEEDSDGHRRALSEKDREIDDLLERQKQNEGAGSAYMKLKEKYRELKEEMQKQEDMWSDLLRQKNDLEVENEELHDRVEEMERIIKASQEGMDEPPAEPSTGTLQSPKIPGAVPPADGISRRKSMMYIMQKMVMRMPAATQTGDLSEHDDQREIHSLFDGLSFFQDRTADFLYDPVKRRYKRRAAAEEGLDVMSKQRDKVKKTLTALCQAQMDSIAQKAGPSLGDSRKAIQQALTDQADARYRSLVDRLDQSYELYEGEYKALSASLKKLQQEKSIVGLSEEVSPLRSNKETQTDASLKATVAKRVRRMSQEDFLKDTGTKPSTLTKEQFAAEGRDILVTWASRLLKEQEGPLSGVNRYRLTQHLTTYYLRKYGLVSLTNAAKQNFSSAVTGQLSSNHFAQLIIRMLCDETDDADSYPLPDFLESKMQHQFINKGHSHTNGSTDFANEGFLRLKFRKLGRLAAQQTSLAVRLLHEMDTIWKGDKDSKKTKRRSGPTGEVQGVDVCLQAANALLKDASPVLTHEFHRCLADFAHMESEAAATPNGDGSRTSSGDPLVRLAALVGMCIVSYMKKAKPHTVVAGTWPVDSWQLIAKGEENASFESVYKWLRHKAKVHFNRSEISAVFAREGLVDKDSAADGANATVSGPAFRRLFMKTMTADYACVVSDASAMWCIVIAAVQEHYHKADVINTIFDQFATSGDGLLQLDEFSAFMRHLDSNVSESTIESIYVTSIDYGEADAFSKAGLLACLEDFSFFASPNFLSRSEELIELARRQEPSLTPLSHSSSSSSSASGRD